MKESKTSYLTEGVLLALATIAAYSFVYSYEKGVCDYYGLPSEVISISLQRSIDFAVRAIVVIYVVCLFVYYYAYVFLFTLEGTLLWGLPKTIIGRWGAVLLLVLILLSLVWFDHMLIQAWIGVVVCVFLLLFIYDFGFSYFDKGDKEWIESIRQTEEARRSETRWWQAMPKHAHTALAIIWLLYVGNNVVASAGAKFAANRVQYPTLLQDGETYAILRVYGDTFYASLYDEDSQKLLGKFTAFEAVGHEWEMANVGPLEKHEVDKE